MITAVYPGSFDPVTLGHMDIIERASKIFDKLIVAVMVNAKKKCLFSAAERVELLSASCMHLHNAEICHSDTLLVDFCSERDADVIIKGLRAVSDFEQEFQMALINRRQNPDIDTMFLMSSEKHLYLSSGIVKEIGALGGDISEFIPGVILPIVNKKIREG